MTHKLIDIAKRDNIDFVTEYENIIKGITVESLADFAKQIVNGNLKEVVQLPVK